MMSALLSLALVESAHATGHRSFTRPTFGGNTAVKEIRDGGVPALRALPPLRLIWCQGPCVSRIDRPETAGRRTPPARGRQRRRLR